MDIEINNNPKKAEEQQVKQEKEEKVETLQVTPQNAKAVQEQSRNSITNF